ncbi:MAG: hypothetical protein M1815_004976 [Lichina confinis]|nr:MAG: hypothetical protein M1815_004976 [Lichina confinis]
MALPGGDVFRAETWSLYAVGMLVIGLRLTARVVKRGIRKLQPDDWLALASVLWYTLLIVSLNQVFFSGGSNFMTAEEEAALTPYTTAQRVAGSKWVLANVIKLTFFWVAAGFVGTQVALFVNCRPFAEYWAVPTQKTQCWSYFNYQIVEAVFNISSDILVLAIAIPILFKLQVPVLQRAILLGIFGMGIFIIAAAILTKLFSLYPPLLTYAYLNWYCREASVCIYVTNLPAIWSLLLDLFPWLRRWTGTTKTPSSGDRGTPSRASRAPRAKEHALQQFTRLGSTTAMPNTGPTESQEHISGLHINKDTTFSVSREVPSSEYDTTISKPSSDKHLDTSSSGDTSKYSAV